MKIKTIWVSKDLGGFFYFIFCLCFLTFSQKAICGDFILVSDIDDTVKITNVNDRLEAAWNLEHGNNTFLGMSELYQEIAKRASNIIYMSGSPESWTDSIRDTLVNKNYFPNGIFYLRNWWRVDDLFEVYKFKYGKMKEVATQNLSGQTDLPFLMLGDDTESDPQVYLDFRKNYPSRALDIYIHQVAGKPLPTRPGPNGEKILEIIPFSTAFDIALNEVEMGRLDADQAIRVGNAILEKNAVELIFPHFVKYCPTRLLYNPLGPVASSHSDLAETSLKVAQLIQQSCANRKHPFSRWHRQ